MKYRPATDNLGVNPFTKEPCEHKVRPATKTVRTHPLKKLKNLTWLLRSESNSSNMHLLKRLPGVFRAGNGKSCACGSAAATRGLSFGIAIALLPSVKLNDFRLWSPVRWRVPAELAGTAPNPSDPQKYLPCWDVLKSATRHVINEVHMTIHLESIGCTYDWVWAS